MSTSNQSVEKGDLRSAEINRSLELAKVGFDHAQRCITLLDTKVGAAMGVILLLLPIPFATVAWLSRLSPEFLEKSGRFSSTHWFICGVVAAVFIVGWLLAAAALLHGIHCLIPRTPKGYQTFGPFQNEWEPNVLFPIFDEKDDLKVERFRQHLNRLSSGASSDFALAEYRNQLEQLGRILGEKVAAMKACYKFLIASILLNGLGLFAGIGVLLLLTK